MKELRLNPRFRDTDALGHINNAAYATWLEEARRPVFELFIPDLDPKKWNLIIARLEIDYLGQGYYQKEVLVQTQVEKIGTSSFVLVQEIIQGDKVIARGRSFLVHFDYQSQASVPIPEAIREKLKNL